MIGRLIINFDNKVYSVLISSYVIDIFTSGVEYPHAKLHFVDNSTLRKFYWEYMRPQFWITKTLLVVDFLGKPHILSSIKMEEPIDTGDSDFLVKLEPLKEIPILPKAQVGYDGNIIRAQDFPGL